MRKKEELKQSLEMDEREKNMEWINYPSIDLRW